MGGWRSPAFLGGSPGGPFCWRPLGPPAQTRSVEGEALRVTPKFRPADQTIEMFLAEIAGRGRSSAGRRGASGWCLGGGLRGVSIACGRLSRCGRLRRSPGTRGLGRKARRWRRRPGTGLLMGAGGGARLGVETRGWPRRSRGGAGRRFPRAPRRRAAAGRYAGAGAEVRETASALFLLATAPAHCGFCILTGRGVRITGPAGLSREVLQAIRGPAAGAQRGARAHQHRGPRRQLPRPQAQRGRSRFGKGAEGKGTQAQWRELLCPPTRLPGCRGARRPSRGRRHCEAGSGAQSLHGTARGGAHCGGPGPSGGVPWLPEEPTGEGNIAPPRRGGLCSRAPPARNPGPRGSGSLLDLVTRPSRRPDSWVPASPGPVGRPSCRRRVPRAAPAGAPLE